MQTAWLYGKLSHTKETPQPVDEPGLSSGDEGEAGGLRAESIPISPRAKMEFERVGASVSHDKYRIHES